MTTKSTYTLCEACRRPIRAGENQRVIQSYRLHANDDCLYTYTVKVEKGILKVPFNMGNKANVLKAIAK